jgi:hypothetical protein
MLSVLCHCQYGVGSGVRGSRMRTSRQVVFDLEVLLLCGHGQVQRRHRVALRLAHGAGAIHGRHCVLARNGDVGRRRGSRGSGRRLEHDRHGAASRCGSRARLLSVERARQRSCAQCLAVIACDAGGEVGSHEANADGSDGREGGWRWYGKRESETAGHTIGEDRAEGLQNGGRGRRRRERWPWEGGGGCASRRCWRWWWRCRWVDGVQRWSGAQWLRCVPLSPLAGTGGLLLLLLLLAAGVLGGWWRAIKVLDPIKQLARNVFRVGLAGFRMSWSSGRGAGLHLLKRVGSVGSGCSGLLDCRCAGGGRSVP